MRALQHYTDLSDIKRCIINTHAIDPQVGRGACGDRGSCVCGNRGPYGTAGEDGVQSNESLVGYRALACPGAGKA